MPAARGTTPRSWSKSTCKEKGTALHDATVVGDTVGDPFKDTTSVALNPIIKFSTLFGLLAVEIAIGIKEAAAAAAEKAKEAGETSRVSWPAISRPSSEW